MRTGRDSSALRIDVAESYEAMSRQAERLITNELKKRPSLLLCASAGGTPGKLYEYLAARRRRQPRLFNRMRILQIDEWGGLAQGHPASCDSDLRTKLIEPLGIAKNRYAGFRTEAADPAAECDRVARWLGVNGPIDICILGLGLNGHVAMNEPGETVTPQAHVARLTASSLKHSMLRQLRQKPRYGLTLGMGDIMSSRIVLLLVNGGHKRKAMRRLMAPQVTTRFPASFLWLHPHTIVMCDREAAPEKRN